MRDDGVGLPGSLGRQLGLEIVETLVREDLRGDWSMAADGGTVARITVPLDPGAVAGYGPLQGVPAA